MRAPGRNRRNRKKPEPVCLYVRDLNRPLGFGFCAECEVREVMAAQRAYFAWLVDTRRVLLSRELSALWLALEREGTEQEEERRAFFVRRQEDIERLRQAEEERRGGQAALQKERQREEEAFVHRAWLAKERLADGTIWRQTREGRLSWQEVLCRREAGSALFIFSCSWQEGVLELHREREAGRADWYCAWYAEGRRRVRLQAPCLWKIAAAIAQARGRADQERK